jgi:TnpA family transposase
MFLRYSPWPPRPRNIKDQRFHTFEQADAYPALTAGYGARTA